MTEFNSFYSGIDRAGTMSARVPSPSPTIDLVENAVSYRKVVVGVFLLCVLLASLVAAVAPPVYSSSALIQVEEKKGSALGSLSTVAKALDVENSSVLGEAELLRSRAVIAEALNATAGDTTVTVKNRFPIIGGWLATVLPTEPNGLAIQPLHAPFWAWGGEDLVLSTFTVPPDRFGKPFELDYEEDRTWTLKDSHGTVVLAGTVGAPSEAAGYKVEVSRITARPGTEFKLIKYPTEVRIDQVLKKLSAEETKRQSSVIRLTFESENRYFPARLVNAIANAYVAKNIEHQNEESRLSLDFLQTQLPAVRERLQKAEVALNAFRNREGSIDLQGEAQNLLDESAAIEKARVAAKMDYQDVAAKYAPGHPLITAAQGRLSELDMESRRLADRIGRLPEIQQQYLRLERDVDVDSRLYIGLMNNMQQLQIAKAGTMGNASIVDRARIPWKPVKPNRIMIVLVGGLLGIILGFAAAQAKALFLESVRDPRRLEALVGIQTVGILPSSPLQRADGLTRERAFLISQEQWDAPLAEAIESLVPIVQFMLAQKPRGKVILVTSAVPGQGKSMISANLAYLFADKRLKVLLVDGDMRRPALSQYLNVRDDRGLSGILSGLSEPRDVIAKLFDNLDALPAGWTRDKVSRLLEDEALGGLMASLRDEYDIVIIDSPPVLPVPDAAVISKHADLTLFVARQGGVSYSEVMEGVARLGKVGTVVDGLVFNDFHPSLLRSGYYSHAYRYMSKPYSSTAQT